MDIFDQAEITGSGNKSEGAHQLMFVVSDGRFEQSQLTTLKQLNRRLAEQHRLLVLIIVDHPDHSIMNERRIIFDGPDIRTPTYLEDYPFPYYVILQDIAQLPEVLADALRQWFELLQQTQN